MTEIRPSEIKHHINQAYEGLMTWLALLDLQTEKYDFHKKCYRKDSIGGFFLPVPETKIVALEKLRGCQLPYALRQYFKTMGESQGLSMLMPTFSYRHSAEDYFELQMEEAAELNETLRKYYPDQADAESLFVLHDHGTAWYCFIRLNEGHNPPVYSIGSGAADLRISSPSLVHFVISRAKATVRDEYEATGYSTHLPPVTDYIDNEVVKMFALEGT